MKLARPKAGIRKLELIHTSPPEKPPTPSTIGPFCIRADCPLIDNNSNKLADFSGYDTNYSIIKKTEDACNRNSNDNCTCEKPKITIIPTHKIQSCNGHIVYKNHVNNSTSIMFPK